MLGNKCKLTSKRLTSAVAVLPAGALALLLALLIGGCGTSWLLMNDVRDFIDDSAPLQIWSGKVTRSETKEAVPDALVVIKSISTAAPHNGGEALEVSAVSNARSTATPPEEKTDTHVGYTDSEGKYRIYFKWYKDRDYTIEAVWLDQDKNTWYALVDRGEITWQDHEADLKLEEYETAAEETPGGVLVGYAEGHPQTWNGKVVDQYSNPVKSAVIVIESRLLGEDLAVTFIGQTDEVGEFSIDFLWRQGANYTIRILHSGTPTETDIHDKGEIANAGVEDETFMIQIPE